MDYIIDQSPLVSLIIPCYNMGDKIHRLFDSILNQTYKKLQVIVVNDGSTDNSEVVIAKYEAIFKKENIHFVLFNKPNGGLGSAINAGLKLVQGDFICWPDADDYLTSDSISKRLQFLLDNPEYGLVRSDAAMYFEDDLKKQVGFMSHKSPNRFKEDDLMKDYILGEDVIFCPGCHMVRTSAFKDVNPQMDIYEGKRGQNYQMLLPLIYKYKFGYIDECLYNFIIYKNSMSRGDDSLDKCIDRNNGLQSYILETLKRMNMTSEDYTYYCNFTNQKYYYLNACRCLDFGDKLAYVKYRQHIVDPYFLDRIKCFDSIANNTFLFRLHLLKFNIKSMVKSNKYLYRLLRNDK